MKTNLREDIYIEGFDELVQLNTICDVYFEDVNAILYRGKTSEVPEELARQLVEFKRNIAGSALIVPRELLLFKTYAYARSNCQFVFRTAVRSILSACPKNYCVIYKPK